ncbi:MAG: hypothetical protein HZB18_18245 [Chloroflexi bacterium]|nr:hypothetical protein [Chloroflexota bacterium]
MKNVVFITFLLITLTACASAQANTADAQNTAIALAWTHISLTQTALPTATLPPPTFTPTATFVEPTPSHIPTAPPPPIFTPDAIQVERWKEYETALVQSVLPTTWDFESMICEWDILARSGQKVYVWAFCGFSGGNDSRPAVIHLRADGSVKSVEVPKRGASSNIDKLFPEEVQAKFGFYTRNSIFDGRLMEMINHLNYRLTHPEEPPLIVLSAMPTATPTP